MRRRKPSNVLVLSGAAVMALLLVQTSPREPAAEPRASRERPAADADRWTLAVSGLSYGTNTASGATGYELMVDVSTTTGPRDAVVTIRSFDTAGRELECWDGERFSAPAGGAHVRTTVRGFTPTDVWERAASFEVFLSRWGCWGEIEALGPGVPGRISRTSATFDPGLADGPEAVPAPGPEAVDDALPPGDLGPLAAPPAGEGC